MGIVFFALVDFFPKASSLLLCPLISGRFKACDVRQYDVQCYMIKKVIVSRNALKQLRKIPSHIAIRLATWVAAVEEESLEEIRKIKGYHDEPLTGSRKGQRSIRLNIAYRAIYEVRKDGSIEFVSIEEVSKHDY